MKYRTLNPATEEVVETFEFASPVEVEEGRFTGGVSFTVKKME